jgi:ferredoxin-fold anticodon binding domain-containing protein
MTYLVGDEVKTPSDCVDIAIVDAYDDEQIYCWVECLGNEFYEVKYVNHLDKKVTFVGFESVDDNNLAAVYKENNKEEKVPLNEIEFIKPTKLQNLWIEGYNLWKSYRS